MLARSVRDGSCLRWTGATNGKQGYGKMFDGIRSEYVHRTAYRVWIGEIPDDLTIDHVLSKGCIYRDCIEPTHLEAVTIQEQHKRRPSPTHCRNGHEFTEANKYYRHGTFVCRKCHADRERARRLTLSSK